MKLIFIDTETTGFEDDPNTEVIEYAFAEWDSDKAGDNKVVRIDSQLVLPKNGCPEQAAKINGYSEQLWIDSGAKHWAQSDVENTLAYLLPGCNIAGSNPRFDTRCLKREFQKHGALTEWPRISHRYLNLASLAWPLWAMQEVESVGLESLAEYFSVEHKAHTAKGDVEASIAVWEKLFDLYVHGPKTMREALVEIGDDARSKGDSELANYCVDHLGCVPWKVGA